jgi:ribonuclease HII
MAALAFQEEDIKKLEWIGVKDSKLLSHETREELFTQIREIVHDFRIEVIEPDAIDLSVTGQGSNLNWLEADTSARMISELQPHIAIFDCPSVNLEAYKNYLLSHLKSSSQSSKPTNQSSHQIELIVEHKADLNHLVVAAASIIAKVIRDRQVSKIKNDIGVDFGSGYMSDPKTQVFLQNYSEKFPDVFRKSWRSYKRIEDKKKQKTLGEY